MHYYRVPAGEMYFTNVLNVRSKYSEEEVDKVRQRPVWAELAEEPSIGEVV